jgi:hypothetical protein
MDGLDDFDPELAVSHYRRVIAQLHAATGIDKHDLRMISARLRVQWKDWQGEDSLHEMAFGEPIE